jgi:hypothetical protein
MNEIKAGDVSCLVEGLNKVSDLVMEEYGCFIAIEVLLITNNIETFQLDSSVKHLCSLLQENKSIMKSIYVANGIDYDENIHFASSIINQEVIKSNQQSASLSEKFFNCKYPFSFPNRFNVICLKGFTGRKSETETKMLSLDDSIHFFEFDDENFRQKEVGKRKNDAAFQKEFCLGELVKLNGSNGKVFVPNSNELSYVETEFVKNVFGQVYSNTAIYQLKFGNLESNVALWPSPVVYKG